jgi:hypothetical protein
MPLVRWTGPRPPSSAGARPCPSWPFFSALALFLMVADARFQGHAARCASRWPRCCTRCTMAGHAPGIAFPECQSSISRPCARCRPRRMRPIASTTCSRSVPIRWSSCILENDRLRKLLGLRERLQSRRPGGPGALRRCRPLQPQGDHRQGHGGPHRAGLTGA